MMGSERRYTAYFQRNGEKVNVSGRTAMDAWDAVGRTWPRHKLRHFARSHKS